MQLSIHNSLNMKRTYLDAYEFYKKRYHDNIILFHVGCEYLAFEDDGVVVSKANNDSISYFKDENGGSFYSFDEDNLRAMLYRLRVLYDLPVTLIEYRNENGMFDVPKVKQIMQDMKDDY